MKNNKELVKHLKKVNAIKTPLIKKAFLNVDRKHFVPDKYKKITYADEPLSIGANQTISQPYTVAFMLELLSPKPNNKVLDVGSGSGWTTALLAEIVGRKGFVFALERIESLKNFGEINVKKLGYTNTKFICKNGYSGLPEEKTFDRILVSAASSKIPISLTNQLSENGKLVMPLNDERHNIVLVKKKENKLEKKYFPGFIFVPFIHD